MSLIGDSLAGGWLGKLAGRLGEGAANGALTAHIGLTAIEVCRPMSFDDERNRPGMYDLLLRAIPDFRKKESPDGTDGSL